MSPISPLIPRQRVPDLNVKLAGGGTWQLSADKPQNFTMVVVYRGMHCPICKGYLSDLQSKLNAFESKGVSVIALSSDTQERAERAKEEWRLGKLPLGFGLTLDQGREWGLYISTSNGKSSLGIVEPDMFVEPGLFLIRPDKTLYFASVQTMPFTRPAFDGVLGAIDFVVAKNYPARGEVIDHKAARATQ